MNCWTRRSKQDDKKDPLLEDIVHWTTGVAEVLDGDEIEVDHRSSAISQEELVGPLQHGHGLGDCTVSGVRTMFGPPAHAGDRRRQDEQCSQWLHYRRPGQPTFGVTVEY